MSALPRPLSRFQELLDLFADPLSVPLGELSHRLALFLGPLPALSAEGDGDPEGISGITRRGPYERLLLSEWALADEVPDEFLRRAAQGEHAFYALTRRATVVARRSVALFDAGPSQLGGPRVAHLALLVLLATRAREAGLGFAWGVLQDPRGELFDAVDRRGIERFLELRSLAEVDLDAAALAERVGDAGPGDEVWLVGGPRLAALAPRCSVILVEDVVAPGSDRVRVTVALRRGPARSHEVELPHDGVCRQLLRRPLRARPEERVDRDRELDVGAGLVFSASGHQVLARRGDGRVLAWPVPREPRKRSRRREVWPEPGDSGGSVVAAGWFRRRPLLVRLLGERLVVEGALGSRGEPQAREELAAPAALRGRGPREPLGRASLHEVGPDRVRTVCFEDRRLREPSLLWGTVVDEPGRALALDMLGAPLLGLLATPERIVAASSTRGGRTSALSLFVWGPQHTRDLVLELPASEEDEVFFADSGWGHPGFGFCAFRRGNTVVIRGAPNVKREARLGTGERLRAVVVVRGQPALLVRHADGVTHSTRGLPGDRELVVDGPLAAPLVASPQGHAVAGILPDGTVFVESVETGERLFEDRPW